MNDSPAHVLKNQLKRKAEDALKEADRLNLNLKPYPNKSGFKHVRKHYDQYIAEVAGRLRMKYTEAKRGTLGRFDTAEEEEEEEDHYHKTVFLVVHDHSFFLVTCGHA